MNQDRANIYRRNEDTLSLESLFVAFVFFTYLSQFLLSVMPSGISQPFRPLIVLILTVQIIRRGRLDLMVCNIALVMSVYQLLVWFFLFPKGGSVWDYMILVLYYMMLFSVAGFPWNRRELQLILYATFLATFVCAVAFSLSNNMTDLSEHELLFMGEHVNRNKNAYAFGLGIVLGSSFLMHGKGRNRILILLMMLLETYCLLYSRCRGAFIGVVMSISVFFISRVIRSMKKGNPYAILYLLTFILLCVAGYFLIKYSPFSRLLDSENYSGRDDLMVHAVDLFKQAPVLGKIFGNGILYEGQNTEGIGVHLVYLTYLLESGLVGTAMVILIFLTVLLRIRGEIQLSLFLVAFSKSFFEGMDYYIFIPLILAVCISNYERLFNDSGRELFYSEKYFRYGR